MALQLLSALDRKSYFQGATHIHAITPGNTPTHWQGGTTAVIGPINEAVYYDRLDRMMGSTAPISGFSAFLFWDPLVVDNTSAASGLVLNAGEAQDHHYCVGEWDKSSNIQRVYKGQFDSTVDRPIIELSPVDWSELSTDIYPNCGIRQARNGTVPGNLGHYRQSVGVDGGGWVFFESYKGGRALKACTDVWDAGGQKARTLADIDLETGLAVPVLEVVQRYITAPAAHQAPPFAGHSFDMIHIQFVPDDDNLLSAPKGRLFFWSTDQPGVLANQRFQYMSVYDWNPEERVGGVPNRVHKRLRFLTRIGMFNVTAVTSGGIGSIYQVADIRPMFHRPTGTVRYYYADGVPGGTETNMTADRTNELVFSGTPALAFVTPPTALSQPKTNGRVNFSCTLLGDVGEPIGGVDVTFELVRVSTNQEDSGTSDGNLGATAGDFSLANVPIDNIADVRSVTTGPTGTENSWDPIPVGTASSGNEVEVNLTNGDLQFFVGGVATDLPLNHTIRADYNHFSVEVTPPHGTLLTLGARSDVSGQVFAEVRYPDDPTLENEWDKLRVTTL